MLSILALVAFAGLLIYAACTDLVSLTIANWVSIALTLLFPVLALAMGMPIAEIAIHLGFGFAVLVIGFFLFQANVFGGGDAKLLGAVAVWTGFAAFGEFAIWTAIAGGVIAAALLSARTYVPQALFPDGFVNRLLTPKSGVPYGVAIMIGGLIALPSLPLTQGALTLP